MTSSFRCAIFLFSACVPLAMTFGLWLIGKHTISCYFQLVFQLSAMLFVVDTALLRIDVSLGPQGVLRFGLDGCVPLEPQNPYPHSTVMLAEKGTHCWKGFFLKNWPIFHKFCDDIGVRCKLLPPCQGGRASLFAVFFQDCSTNGHHWCYIHLTSTSSDSEIQRIHHVRMSWFYITK